MAPEDRRGGVLGAGVGLGHEVGGDALCARVERFATRLAGCPNGGLHRLGRDGDVVGRRLAGVHAGNV
jgi:hypothetical protein